MARDEARPVPGWSGPAELAMPTPDSPYLSEVEADAEAELAMAEASRPEETLGRPQREWLFDAADIARTEVRLRSLVGAVEALQQDNRRQRQDQPNRGVEPPL